MQTACWQLCFPIVLRELGTRHASPPRFNPVESGAPPHSVASWWVLQDQCSTGRGGTGRGKRLGKKGRPRIARGAGREVRLGQWAGCAWSKPGEDSLQSRYA